MTLYCAYNTKYEKLVINVNLLWRCVMAIHVELVSIITDPASNIGNKKMFQQIRVADGFFLL